MTLKSLGVAAALAIPAVPALAPAQNVAEVQVAPPTVTLRVGERTGVLATAFDRLGNVIPTIRIIWSSNNTAIARVDNSGTVTGVAGGVAIIQAQAGTRKGQVLVQVTGGPPAAGGGGGEAGHDPLAGQPGGTGAAAALRIDPPAIYLLPSEVVRAAPRALREDGSAATPIRVTWKSLREDVASVDQNGNVVALSSGQGTIQITGTGGLTATAPVVVQQADIAVAEPGPILLSPGDSLRLHVIVPTQNNRLVSPVALQWSSSNPTVARVNLLGFVTAAGPGRATLSVTGLLQTRTVDVTVHRPVEVLVARPTPRNELTIPLTGTQRFDVQGLAADNTPVPEAPMRWSVVDSTIATFNPATGLLTGRGVGRTQLVVRAPGQGLSVTWTVNVVGGSPRLTTSRAGIAPGERMQLRGDYVDDSGAVIGPATNLAWASDKPNVATVANDGTVSAVGYGRATITATAPGGRSVAADLFVQGEMLVASNRGGRYQLFALERGNLSQLRRVTDDTASAIDPAYSADGSRIAFVSGRHGNPEIYVMDADGASTVRLTTHASADGHPAFTPDGRAIVFHAQRTKGLQIYVVGLDGGQPQQLTQEPARNFMPTVSPDGGTIAFVREQGNTTDIWLMARDGTSQRAFQPSPTQKESYPRFLRDGSLAYLVERREGNRTVTQVVKADLATGQVTALTGTDLSISAFAIAPAGDLLALVVPLAGQSRTSPYRVYVQPAGSGAPVPVPGGAQEQMATPAIQP